MVAKVVSKPVIVAKIVSIKVRFFENFNLCNFMNLLHT